MGAERGWVSGRQRHDKLLLQPQQEGLWPNSKDFAQVGVWGQDWGSGAHGRTISASISFICCPEWCDFLPWRCLQQPR